MSAPLTPSRLVATFGLVGELPGAPGTWGSLAAIPLAWALHALGGFPLLAAATVVVFAGGWWATRTYLEGRADDPSEVVIDEVAGMMIALWPLSFGLGMTEAEAWEFPWPGWVVGFFLFRFFDIVKPPPVSWADRMKTPFGVMLDDAIAGVLAAIVATVAAGVSHGWFA